MANLEMPVNLTYMFSGCDGEPVDHRENPCKHTENIHIQSTVFICWETGKINHTKQSFQTTEKRPSKHNFFSCLCCLQLLNSLMYHTDTQTPTYGRRLSYYIRSWKWPTPLTLFCQSLWEQLSLPNSSLHITFPAALLVSAHQSLRPATSWHWRCWCSTSVWLSRTEQISHDICVTLGIAWAVCPLGPGYCTCRQ